MLLDVALHEGRGTDHGGDPLQLGDHLGRQHP